MARTPKLIRSVCLTPSQDDALRRLADAADTSASAVMRQALTAFLATQATPASAPSRPADAP